MKIIPVNPRDGATAEWIEIDTAEASDLKAEISQLKEELKKERECVDFYASIINWEHLNNNDQFAWFRRAIPITDCDQPDNEEWASYGGKLARETQKQRKVIL